MPPKKNQVSKKTVEKKKEQMLEDKTFGLKNKNKSKQVQKYVQQVQHQVKGTSEAQERKKLDDKKAAAAAKEAIEKQMKDLFMAAIVQPKVPLGVDPKTIVCEFFKQATCAKGNRCKFSHDLMVGKKATKINLYEDDRDAKDADIMDTWDQKKLEDVVAEKHGQKVATTTDIVCKFFLDAIEKSQYGWFWTCPNGGKSCKYRHALPPGFVYQSKKDRENSKKKGDEVSIEEIIEQQRAKLGANGGTPVTAESFAKWKTEKAKRKLVEDEKRRKDEAKKSGNRGLNTLSGRALFTFDPTLFQDDDGAAGDEYEVEDYEDEEKRPAPDAASASMDQSLYMQDVEDNLDELVEE
ncbi:hypothetical protein SDRG_07262 [Saprolegnia diclina VS20]|uniref:C3H1-type domain-containing protein n=1 Tax=Saprolegnia diclina (strain VS20) TaxID=1156394 RepID=T0RXI8_SAPDV|nr:hypothetical protein SDRG_07262 [Saprolegnia diclina VS20]EQC35022.1 hypothetical protein SDRG_07262 [Saprolegnia diclina VS20]|eukprot:XP_008611306.1 hypothetical protein SDRG_07262 [Saprolegnia diclina VS20]